MLIFLIPYLVFHGNRLPESETEAFGVISELSVVTIDWAVSILAGIVIIVGAFNVLISNWLVVDVIFWNVF